MSGRKILAALMLLILISSAMPQQASAFNITSPFGWRVHPISGEYQFHDGIDIAADTGTPIPAVWGGEVILAGEYRGYGMTVVIYHGNNTYTLYGHASQILVTVGQKVEQGTVIALVGSTGYSTGPHLHLSLVRNGNYVDPMTIWQ